MVFITGKKLKHGYLFVLCYPNQMTDLFSSITFIWNIALNSILLKCKVIITLTVINTLYLSCFFAIVDLSFLQKQSWHHCQKKHLDFF